MNTCIFLLGYAVIQKERPISFWGCVQGCVPPPRPPKKRILAVGGGEGGLQFSSERAFKIGLSATDVYIYHKPPGFVYFTQPSLVWGAVRGGGVLGWGFVLLRRT